MTHLRNNVIGYVALFFALTAGAYAVTTAPENSVGSKSVKDDSLKGRDIGDDRIKGIDVKESTLDLPAEQVLEKVKTVDGAGSGLDAELLDGEDSGSYIGPRAYGRVAANGDFSRSKGVASVGNPAAGIYCLNLPGVDPATSPLIAGTDSAGGGTDFGTLSTNDALAMQEWDSSGADCPPGQYEVLTGVWFKITEAQGGDDLQHLNGSFAFIVP